MKKTRADLKLRFKTGDTPTQEDFANLIESVVNCVDDGVDVEGSKLKVTMPAQLCGSSNSGALGLAVDAKGKVGIGTNEPRARLTVVSGGTPGTQTRLPSDFRSTGDNRLYGDYDAAGINAGDCIVFKETRRQVVSVSSLPVPNVLLSEPGFPKSSGPFYLERSDAAFEAIDSSGALQFLISGSGMVGIGKANPDSMLDVKGTVRLRGPKGGANAGLTVDADGNVGIGTKAPQARLEVKGGTTVLQQEDWQAIKGTPKNEPPAGYFKDSQGIVHLRGVVGYSGKSKQLFLLPVGYRPENPVAQLGVIASQDQKNPTLEAAPIFITQEGTTVVETRTTGNIYLDGITFRAAQ